MEAGRVTHRPGEPDPDRVLYSTEVVTVGRFRAPVDHPQFRDSGPTRHHLFVFPRTSVVIRHEGRRPVTADPCTVTFYNRGQRYTRERVDPRGDHCEWFAVRPDVLRDILADFEPRAVERPERPFRRTHGRSDSRTYAVQRTITRHLAAATAPDPLAVDEAVIAVLERVLALTHDPSPAPTGRVNPPSESPNPLVRAVRGYLRRRFRETCTLDDIADSIGSSVFHLCRVFKRDTGMTIHAYRQQLRLRRALELIADDGRKNLTAVALRLGFSSHSHFSAVFRDAFGITPSQFRRHPSLRRIRELAGRLSASA